MSAHKSLESVRHTLRRRGLPRVYVERVIKEFEDHRIDIVEEQRLKGRSGGGAESAAFERLGEPGNLAETVVAQYQARSFLGRHPALTFLLGPLPVVILAWAAFTAVSLGLIALLGSMFGSLDGATIGEMHGAMLWTVLALHHASVVVPWAMAAIALCALARYTGRGLGWLLAACGVVAIVALAFQTGMTLPVAPGTGQFMIALGASSATLTSVQQVFQACIPLAVFALFAAQIRYRERLVELA